MFLNDLDNGVGEVSFRVYGVEAAGLDQRGDDSPVFGAAVGAGEEGVFASQGDGLDRAFGSVRA